MRSIHLLIPLVLLASAACAPMQGDTPAPPPPPTDGPGQCRADIYRGYIGRNRSALPAQPPGETWRVTCTTCPVTMDFNPNRLNILYTEADNLIREVKCG